jgi:acyl transferase domain-containing protein/acyl carrier protein
MPSHAIAIVGMAGRFPGADGLEAFWRQIIEGVECLDTLSDADLEAAGVPAALHRHPQYVKRGTYLEQSEWFDAGFFGFSPREAQVLDPQQRVFLECAWEALEHAGYAPDTLPESVGVYGGASMNTYLYAQLLRNPALIESVGGYQLMLGNDKDFLCTRVSYKLGLRGPSLTIQTACSTSLVAVQVACRALQRGECDMALAGGVSIAFPLRAGYLYQDGMILSPDGHCRPFDALARGTRAGAGAGIVVLKPLSQALADGDTVHAIIRGIAVNNDGADKAGYTAPSVEGQAEVIATAQALAGVRARSIGYVEAHGTATPLGDPIEVAALTMAFGVDTTDRGYCRLGSLKANLGHLDAAAGVAGLIKTVLALQHRELPPLVNFSSPNPALRLETSPFHASAAAELWPSEAGVPRRAGVSSFGIGGTNAHAVIEEAPARTALADRHEPQLLVWSARSESALDAASARLAAHLEAHPEKSLADVAWTLQLGRQAFSYRRAVVVADSAAAVAALRDPQRAGLLAGRHEGGERAVAFSFSGQGSQHAGMGRGLYEGFPSYREAVDRCATLLEPHLGCDIRDVMYGSDTDAALGETRFAQPALFVSEYALAVLWGEIGVVAKAMLGHSIGEYVAAHLAGVMSLEDALAVVAARGRLMQQMAPGRMAAVPLGAAELDRWLFNAAGVEIAAINAPQLCTVAGPTDALEALLARLAAAGIEGRALRTAHAFHSAMMEPALVPFTAFLQQVALSPPTIPYVSNVTGTWITPQQATSPAYYAEQLRRTVQFEAGLRTLIEEANPLVLEVGPGTALASLARLNLGGSGARRVVASMRHPADVRGDAEALLDAIARMWLGGVPVRWRGLHAVQGRRVPLPTYPFERQRYTVDAAPAGPVDAANISDAEPVLRRSSRIDDWFYAPTWTRDDALPTTSAPAQWLVLGNGSAWVRELCESLRRMGLEPVLVEHGESCAALDVAHWRVRRGQAGDLVQMLREHGISQLGGALHLWALPATEGSALSAEDTYESLVALAAGLPSSTSTPVTVLHASAGAESVCGEPVRSSASALAVGPVLVLPTELPGVRMRSVDLECVEGIVDTGAAIASLTLEVGLDDAEPQVAHRAGCRWVRRYERIALPPATPDQLPLRHQGCYLITGGLGGMGLTLARWLGARFGARLVLTSRQSLPPCDAWDDWLARHDVDERLAAVINTIRGIEASGGEVLVCAADAANLADMNAVLATARARFGELHGVIHAAGVSGRGSVALRTRPEEVHGVFAPKVRGLNVLLELLGTTSLDFVALMSSINAVAGAPGASDYAAANAVLDAFVESVERPAGWRHVVTVDWGAWRDVGMATRLQVPDALREQWKAHLAGAIPPDAGIEAFARVLASRRRRVVVETYDVVRRHELMRHPLAPQTAGPDHGSAAARGPAKAHAGTASGSTSNAVPTRPALSSAYAPPTTPTEQRLAATWQELLGIEGIGINDDFFELGGHSLMATRVLARITETLGVRLTLRDIFDAPTVAGLAARMPTPAATPGTDEEREELEF